MTIALLVAAPLSWFALAADPPPDGQDNTGPSTSNVVPFDPTVSDGLTGGALPSLPVPANPVPGSLPAVPTDVDPQGTDPVADGPVTITLSGKASGTLVVDGRDVQGTASGLNPAYRYISLAYGDQSNSRPGEVFTCADVRTAANVRGWAVSGEWEVAPDGTASLSGTLARDLSDGVQTMSIRRLGGLQALPSGPIGDDPLTGFTPVTAPVVACGSVPR